MQAPSLKTGHQLSLVLLPRYLKCQGLGPGCCPGLSSIIHPSCRLVPALHCYWQELEGNWERPVGTHHGYKVSSSSPSTSIVFFFFFFFMPLFGAVPCCPVIRRSRGRGRVSHLGVLFPPPRDETGSVRPRHNFCSKLATLLCSRPLAPRR